LPAHPLRDPNSFWLPVGSFSSPGADWSTDTNQCSCDFRKRKENNLGSRRDWRWF